MLEKIIKSYVTKMNYGITLRKFFIRIFFRKLNFSLQKRQNNKIVKITFRLITAFKSLQRQVKINKERRIKNELAYKYRADRLCQKFFGYFNNRSINKMRLINLIKDYYMKNKQEVKEEIIQQYQK